MRPFLVIPSLALLALAACSEPGSKEASDSAPAAATAATLGGVDLAQPVGALGTEPFWSVRITPGAVTYVSLEGETLTGANPGPAVQGTTALYATTVGDRPLEVTLIATECSDGMSDRTYPLTAIVKLGDTQLNGCANSQAALDAQPPV